MVTSNDLELNLCVEVAIEDGGWAERLPPAPGSSDTAPVTVSFDDLELAARDRTAVTALGYQVVGTGAVRHVSDVAHVMVSLSTVERHPRWWRGLLDIAVRVYDLRFGPVQMALSDVLRAHREQRHNGTAPMHDQLRSRTRRPPNV